MLFIISVLLTYALIDQRKDDSSITQLLTEQRSLVNRYVRDFFYYLKTNDISKVSIIIKQFENNIKVISLQGNGLGVLSAKSTDDWKKLKKLAGLIILKDKRTQENYNSMLEISNRIDQRYAKTVFSRQKQYSQYWRNIFLFQLLSALLTISLSIFVMFKVNRKIVAGINEVKDAAIDLSKGKFIKLSNNFSNDEVGQLASAIKSTNTLIEQLNYQKESLKIEIYEKEKIQKQMISHEKLASLGAISSGIAHELRNPLNFILNFSKALVHNFKEDFDVCREEIEEISQIINKHALRANNIINQILGHTSTNKEKQELTDLPRLVDDTLNLNYNSLLIKRNTSIEIIKNYDSMDKVNIYRRDFTTALSNIFDNSLHSLMIKLDSLKEFNPTLKIEIKVLTIEEQVKIIIEDNGIGIPKEHVGSIFNPFFTTKPTGEGSGLGLTMCYDIISTYKGKIEVKSAEGEWTRFTITIPIEIS